jgi:hypothetical protein
MSVYPPAIIYCNNDLTDGTESRLIRQLYIDETMDGYTFDANVAGDANYISNQKLAGKRIMVVRDLYQLDYSNADLVIYLKYNLVTVDKNATCGVRATFELTNLNWKELGFTGGNHSIL